MVKKTSLKFYPLQHKLILGKSKCVTSCVILFNLPLLTKLVIILIFLNIFKQPNSFKIT